MAPLLSPPAAPVATAAPASANLFMVLFVSALLFLTASALRLVPRGPPASPADADALLQFPQTAYGGTDGLLPVPLLPSYEALLAIEDRIGDAKHGLNDAQISIFPKYRCAEHDAHAQERRGLYCAICRDVYVMAQEVIVLPCTDEFHSVCITPWLKLQPTCPLCRCRFA